MLRRISPVLHAIGGAATALAVGAAGLGFLADFRLADGATSTRSAAEPVPTDGADFSAQFADRVSAAADALLTLNPLQVANLWIELPREFIDGLIDARPDVVGNLEGASYVDRDRANIIRLEAVREESLATSRQALARFRATAPHGASGIDVALSDARVEAVEVLLGLFRKTPAGAEEPRRYLVSLDASAEGPPLAAISVGNLDSALFATYFVPGMNSSVLEAEDYLRGVTRIQQASPDSAAVLWLGYRSPGPVETVSTARAEAGAVLLGQALTGYDSYRDTVGLPSELTVLAHSYGSTTAAIALADRDYGVSSFIMIGSAGVPSDISLDDLRVMPDRVYASEAMGDAMAGSGQFWSGRVNPASADWGAQLFGSNGTTLEDGTVLAAVRAHDAVGPDTEADHEKYLGDGTESLYAIRKIVTGDRSAIAPGTEVPSTASTILAEGSR